MKAAVLKAFGEPFVIEEVPVPSIGPDDVLIKVAACGLCGTDVKISAGKRKDTPLPHIQGHEVSGVIHEVGANVSGLKAGDRGVVHFYCSCHKCEYCLSDRETLCQHMPGRLGFTMDGGLAEYVAAPATNFIPIPDSVTLKDASILADAISTSYRGLKKGDVGPGTRVLVVGLGGLGIHACQLAQAMGADVVGTTRSMEKIDYARSFGLEKYVQAGGDSAQQIIAAFGGHKADVVIETVTNPQTLPIDMAVMAPSARLVLLGYSFDVPMSIPAYPLVQDELSIYASRASSHGDIAATLPWLESGKIRAAISNTYSLDEINVAMDQLRAGQCLGRQVILFE